MGWVCAASREAPSGVASSAEDRAGFVEARAQGALINEVSAQVKSAQSPIASSRPPTTPSGPGAGPRAPFACP
eukprot:4160373-Pyramimonas_sp.AAC.1